MAFPSTEKWYNWPSVSVKTKCSFATSGKGFSLSSLGSEKYSFCKKLLNKRVNLPGLLDFSLISASCFFFNDFKLCRGDHSRAVIGGNFLGIVRSRFRFFKSHNSNGAFLKATMKNCLSCDTLIMSMGGSSDLWDLRGVDLPVLTSV